MLNKAAIKSTTGMPRIRDEMQAGMGKRDSYKFSIIESDQDSVKEQHLNPRGKAAAASRFCFLWKFQWSIRSKKPDLKKVLQINSKQMAFGSILCQR